MDDRGPGRLRSYPHLLGSEVLRVRNGALHDIAIPWRAVVQVTTEDRSLHFSMWVLQPITALSFWVDEPREVAVTVAKPWATMRGPRTR